MSRSCGSCGEAAPDDANWCEACGADLEPPPGAPQPDPAPRYVATVPCVSCGADITEITDDGWCQMCGTRQPAPGDHVTDDRGSFALVSDRGKRHRTNEDAGSIDANDANLVLVVCDGVSTTDDAHHASQAAAAAAAHVLVTSTEPAGPRLVEAAAAGQRAVVDASADGSDAPSSCTFVAAIATPSGNDATPDTTGVTIGWLGDSRVYWIGTDDARCLTRDHNWSIEQRTLGQLSDEDIAADPRAHSITRWLGADSLDVTPEVVEAVLDPGLLIVCSDGLWNYADEAAALGDLVRRLDPDGALAPLELAEQLVDFANEAGGHDNITVALARLPLTLDATGTGTATGTDDGDLGDESPPRGDDKPADDESTDEDPDDEVPATRSVTTTDTHTHSNAGDVSGPTTN